MSLTHADELKKRRNPFCEPPMAVIGSKPPEANAAMRPFTKCRTALSELNPQIRPYGLSLSAVRHLASLTRKTRPSAASGYQAIFCSQGIKRPAYMPPAFDGLYSLRIYPSYIR